MRYNPPMTIQQKIKMTAGDFLVWAAAQTTGRYELVDGEPVRMSPERAIHNKVKGRIFLVLEDAVTRSRNGCDVFTDGMTVLVDGPNGHRAREPDAAVQCGVVQDLESTVLAAPLIVVEVTSPSNERDDTAAKLVEYFSVPSIQHYLIVMPDKRVVVHHQRTGDSIATAIVTGGRLVLDPPGLSVPFDDVWPAPRSIAT
jgi:Uma2 family endonuclease